MVPLLRPRTAASPQPTSTTRRTSTSRRLHQGLLRKAKAGGARLLTDAALTRRPSQRAAGGSRRRAATIEAGIIVNAAGAWADPCRRGLRARAARHPADAAHDGRAAGARRSSTSRAGR